MAVSVIVRNLPPAGLPALVKRTTIVAGGVVITLLGAVAVAGAVAGVGPAATLFGEEPKPPALLSFESAGAQCTDDFTANSSTTVASGGTNTQVTFARNVSLPGPSEAVGGPSFERRNESTYELSIPTGETRKAPRNCSGVARYRASMRIPAGDDPWQIVVQHDDETVTVLEGDSDSTSVSGSASGGQRVR
jgi:hypothetical protein